MSSFFQQEHLKKHKRGGGLFESPSSQTKNEGLLIINVGFGQRAYSTVIEGLKYASSHEWYVVASLSLFFFVRRVLFASALFFVGVVVCGFTDDDDDDILSRNDDADGEKHLSRATTKAVV